MKLLIFVILTVFLASLADACLVVTVNYHWQRFPGPIFDLNGYIVDNGALKCSTGHPNPFLNSNDYEFHVCARPGLRAGPRVKGIIHRVGFEDYEMSYWDNFGVLRRFKLENSIKGIPENERRDKGRYKLTARVFGC